MDAISGIDYQSIGGIELSFDTRQSNSKDQGKRSGFSVAAANPEKNTDATGLKLDSEKQKIVQEMKARDTEVRAHEQAHIAASGGNAKGGASFTMQRGPDGVMYATGGEVSIDTSSVPDNPDATIEKARQIQAAANAPANPSSQDRAVAASAAQMEAQAQQEKTQKSQNGEDGESGKNGLTSESQSGANKSDATQGTEYTSQGRDAQNTQGANNPSAPSAYAANPSGLAGQANQAGLNWAGQAMAPGANSQQALFSGGNASGLVPGQYYQSLGFTVSASGNSAQSQPFLIFNAPAQSQNQAVAQSAQASQNGSNSIMGNQANWGSQSNQSNQSNKGNQALSPASRMASSAYARQTGTSALAPLGTGISRTA